MNTHEAYSDLLPVYAAGHLDGEQRRELECHLQECATCRDDFVLWQAIGAEIVTANRPVKAHPALAERTLQSLQTSASARTHLTHRLLSPFASMIKRAWQLLRVQVPLVKQEMWPAAALVMAIGCLLAILFKNEAALRILAPLVTAASLAVIYGPEHDPAAELMLSTPTSPWKILLARVTVVFGYNLLLALGISLLLLAFIPVETLGGLILGWLAPMTFLSALALVLSLWVGTTNALMMAYMGWLAQFTPFFMKSMAMSDWFSRITEGYAQLWQSPPILLAAAVLLLVIALWSVRIPEHNLRMQW